MSSNTLAAADGQPPEPSVRREFISPARAKELLSTIKHERRLQESWVTHLAKLLVDGRFQEIGDTIRMSWDDSLLDGQHRLNAIARGDIGVWMWVVYGLDPQSQDVMDRGRRRTVGDVLTIHGFSQGTTLAAAVRWVVAIEDGRFNTGSSSRNERTAIQLDPDETLEALEKYPDLVGSLRIGSEIHRAAVRYPPSLASALHYLMARRAGTDVADEFYESLANGTELQKGDPIWRLLDQLHRDETKRFKRPSIDVAAWTIKAWNAWRANRPVGVLKYYPGSFPIMDD